MGGSEWFDAWSVENLYQVVWGLAKIQDASGLRMLCYQALGDQLSDRVEVLQPTHLSAIVWAFAKSGHRHPALFEAVAHQLDSNRLTLYEARHVSNIVWAFATLQVCHREAFAQLAHSHLQLINTFNNQDVANSVWSFSKLGVPNEQLFSALMQRADFTLYDDTYRYHEIISERTRDLSWCQVYLGYCFCCTRCPSTIATLSRRLASDFQKISTKDSEDGLSSGSGLESADRVQQLDAMLAEMEEVGDGILDEDAEALPSGSLEADPGNLPSPRVAARNAARARSLLGIASTQTVKIIILKFSRSPEVFRQALMEGLELSDCRQSLINAGLDPKLSSGAKAFVRPEHFEAMCEAIFSTHIQLRTSHVLVAEEFESRVLSAIANLSRSQGVRCRDREYLDLSEDELSTAWGKLTVKRTFFELRVPKRSSLPHSV